MQIDVPSYLRLVENAGTLAFVDIEASGLRGDYNSILCISLKPFGKKPFSFAVKQVGNDQKIIREAKEAMAEFDCWVTYYGSGFDIPMINTRLLKWEQTPLPSRHHIDMYYKLKSKLLTARKSQGHLLSWLGTDEQKMGVSADVWNMIASDTEKHMPEMIKRCESDVKGLEGLYSKTKHIIADIKRT